MSNPPVKPGVLILAGGRGERFWPWSTPARPKQLLPLASGGRTLLRATYERALRLVAGPADVVVMTSEELRAACAAECPGARVLGEPMMRNTAPAIAAAASVFAPGTPFAVMPADHAIDDEAAFTSDARRAIQLAGRDAVLVTFGIRPTHAETNFGYIHRGGALAAGLHRVSTFKEKPDRPTAEAWLASGDYLWNSGIFVWSKETFYAALSVRHPEIAALRDFAWDGGDGAFGAALRPRFEPLAKISVDYAVLEGAPNTVVIEAAFDWDDLGSWNAWARRQPHDARGNVTWGDAVAVDCDDCVVVGDGVTAAPLGLRNMVLVATRDGVLACATDASEQVRRVSEAVRARSRP
jgi:mannose-1-phosphate guanylyltransferase/mannose-6-phosphate isomerase